MASKNEPAIASGVNVSRRTFLAATGAAGLTALAGPRPAFAAGSGRLVVYSTTLPPIQKRLVEVFTQKTGIQVQSLRLPTSPLAQRFLAEQKAGQYLCDVITLGHDVFFNEISDLGLLDDIDDIPGVAGWPAAWRPGRQFLTIMIGPHSIGYNTNLVTGSSIPTGWTDILKPEFKDQIVLADPRANEPIILFFVTLHDAFGDEFLERLRAQNPLMVPSVPRGIEGVIAGEAKLIVPGLAMNLIQYSGKNAPVAIIPTPSPTNGTYFFSGVVSTAPNKAEARLWYEFVLSPEGQEILCKDNGVSPLGDDIPGSLKAPEHLVSPDLEESVKRADRLYDLLGLSA